MAQELDIDIKVTGLADLRSQLKAAKDDVIALQSADVIDPNKLAEATKRAGALKDALNDANEQIKVMSGGSDFEKVSNGLGLIGSQLKDMDFEGAANSAKNLTKVVQAMNPATVAKGFSDLAGTVLQLGKAFVTMGIQLLANPIFLIVAVIVAVVVAIVMLKDKLKIAEQAFDLLMRPIKALIQGLKDLTDWLGITSFEMEENADRTVAANEKKIASNEKVTASVDKEYAFQIALAKANGQDVTELQIKQLQFDETQAKERQKIASDNIATIDKLEKEGKGKLTQDQIKARNEATAEYVKERDAAIGFNQARIVLRAEANTKLRQENIKAGQKSKDDQDKIDKAAEDAAKRHLTIIRGLRDLELSNMEEGLKKDLAMNQEKYKRELEDLKTNKDMTKSEREKYAAEYLVQKEIEDKKAYETEKKRVEEIAKLEKEARDKELAEIEANRVKIINYNKNYADYILQKTGSDLDKRKAVIKKDMDDAIANENSRFFAELNNLKLTQFEKENLEREHQKRIRKIKGIAADENTQAEQESKAMEIAATIDKYTQIAEKAMVGVNAINGFLNQNDENRLNSVKEKQTEEINAITQKQNEELSVTGLSEAQKQAINDKYAKLKYAADLKAFNETEKIKKAQFARDKALRMVGVVIDTAKAISGSIAASPLTAGMPWAAINAAVGAIQLATIASQKYQGEAGPSAPSVGGAGGGGSSTPVEPSIGLFGQRNVGSTATAAQSVEANQNIMVTAVVSETEITNVQGRANRIRQSAEL